MNVISLPDARRHIMIKNKFWLIGILCIIRIFYKVYNFVLEHDLNFKVYNFVL